MPAGLYTCNRRDDADRVDRVGRLHMRHMIREDSRDKVGVGTSSRLFVRRASAGNRLLAASKGDMIRATLSCMILFVKLCHLNCIASRRVALRRVN